MKNQSKSIHLSNHHKKMLESLFLQYLPEVEVWAYGSRVNKKSHSSSDLDLVLRSSNLSKISYSKLCKFQDALKNSNIPFVVEVRDWATLPHCFHAEIQSNYIVLFKANDPL